MPPASKTTGNYVNSSLAKVEALKAGYDEAVMLAPNGSSPSVRARTSSRAQRPDHQPAAVGGRARGDHPEHGDDLGPRVGHDVVLDNLARKRLVRPPRSCSFVAPPPRCPP
ncbi:MAG: hypothetical protein R2705_19055 [Ilumatobacteraceae bacterium]